MASVLRPEWNVLEPLPQARISLVVVTHNHADSIEACLRSALDVAPSQTPVLVLDNASQDGTASIAGSVPGVRVVETGGNPGFSASMNRGIAACRSDFVLALGPDVQLQPGFFDALIPTLGPGVAMATGLLLDASDPDLIDDAGTILTTGRQFKSRGAGQRNQAQYAAGEVLAVCGGCCLLRRDAIPDLMLAGELFDEDFFAYKEDVDLGWRAHLLGWTCRFEPMAKALHARKGARAGSPLMWQLSIRNRLLVLLKNEDASTALLRLPELVALEAYQLFNHLSAYRPTETARLMPTMLRKRRILAVRRRLGARGMRARLRALRDGASVGSGRDPV